MLGCKRVKEETFTQNGEFRSSNHLTPDRRITSTPGSHCEPPG